MSIEKTCPFCNKRFSIKASLARVKYCSRSCLDQAKEEKECLVCKKTFFAPAAMASRSKYCSDFCRVRSGPIKKSCEACGSEFSVRSNRAKTAKFCSQECQFGIMRSERTCDTCNIKFIRPNSNKQKFCSLMCATNSFVDQITLKCNYCDSEYLTKKSHKNRSNFCSLLCANGSKLMDRDFPLPILVEGSKWIQLGHDRFTLVDEDDYHILNKHNWSVHKKYAYRIELIDGKRVHIYMHRLLTDAPSLQEIDHINGDTLDNRKSNLRFATRSQNAMNKVDRGVGSETGYRGVYFTKNNCFYSIITINRKQLYLGTYNYAKSAAEAYDDAARLYFGEYGRYNFPREGEQKA